MTNRISKAWNNFVHTESSGGIVLLAVAIIAMIWANSSMSGVYESLKTIPVDIVVGSFVLNKNLLLIINDGLMVIFFYVIGLELKRELIVGELSSPKKAGLSIMAAIGGMVVPASFYMFLNWSNPENIAGWGIPMATDIAFAIGILALIPGVPRPLKVFLLALAIVDDLGAILVIAFFYTSKVSMEWLGVAAGALGFLYLMGVMGVRNLAVGLFIGFVTWLAFLKSGVHATIAGVLLAFLTPRQFVGEQKPDEAPFIDHWIHVLHPWVAFFIIPVFALFNAGVNVGNISVENPLMSPVALGIILGLVAGKPLGVAVFAYIGTLLKLCELPRGVGWIQLVGVGSLAGVGFTMAIFINSLAFGASVNGEVAKLSILVASIISAVLGFGLLRLTRSASEESGVELNPATE